jgi:hypothetical protein
VAIAAQPSTTIAELKEMTADKIRMKLGIAVVPELDDMLDPHEGWLDPAYTLELLALDEFTTTVAHLEMRGEERETVVAHVRNDQARFVQLHQSQAKEMEQLGIEQAQVDSLIESLPEACAEPDERDPALPLAHGGDPGAKRADEWAVDIEILMADLRGSLAAHADDPPSPSSGQRGSSKQPPLDTGGRLEEIDSWLAGVLLSDVVVPADRFVIGDVAIDGNNLKEPDQNPDTGSKATTDASGPISEAASSLSSIHNTSFQKFGAFGHIIDLSGFHAVLIEKSDPSAEALRYSDEERRIVQNLEADEARTERRALYRHKLQILLRSDFLPEKLDQKLDEIFGNQTGLVLSSSMEGLLGMLYSGPKDLSDAAFDEMLAQLASNDPTAILRQDPVAARFTGESKIICR